MTIFNSYISLPEGTWNPPLRPWKKKHGSLQMFPFYHPYEISILGLFCAEEVGVWKCPIAWWTHYEIYIGNMVWSKPNQRQWLGRGSKSQTGGFSLFKTHLDLTLLCIQHACSDIRFESRYKLGCHGHRRSWFPSIKPSCAPWGKATWGCYQSNHIP